jgi:hypothetical protein
MMGDDDIQNNGTGVEEGLGEAASDSDEDTPLRARPYLIRPDIPEDVKKFIVSEARDRITLEEELMNAARISEAFRPNSGEIPVLEGIDIFGETVAKQRNLIDTGGRMPTGGDQLSWYSFTQRHNIDKRVRRERELHLHEPPSQLERSLFQSRHRGFFGMFDVTGHHLTDSSLGENSHQGLMLIGGYEFDLHADITVEGIERLNSRLFRTSALTVNPGAKGAIGVVKMITAIFVEMYEGGKIH